MRSPATLSQRLCIETHPNEHTQSLRRQLEGMRLKQARLSRAIRERELALNRLEASAVLGATLPVRSSHG